MKRFGVKRAKGQAIVEYIIIIVLVALASITIIGMFSDTLREKVAGIINTFSSSKDTNSALDKKSTEILKETEKEGLDITK